MLTFANWVQSRTMAAGICSDMMQECVEQMLRLVDNIDKKSDDVPEMMKGPNKGGECSCKWKSLLQWFQDDNLAATLAEEKKNEPIVGFSPKRGSIQFAKIISDPIKATATHVNEATAEGMFEICSKEWIVKACLVKTEPDSPTCDTITTSVIIVPVRCVVVHSEVPNRGDDTTYIHLRKSPRGHRIPPKTRTAYKNLAY